MVPALGRSHVTAKYHLKTKSSKHIISLKFAKDITFLQVTLHEQKFPRPNPQLEQFTELREIFNICSYDELYNENDVLKRKRIISGPINVPYLTTLITNIKHSLW